MSTGALAGMRSSAKILVCRRRLEAALGRLWAGGGHIFQKAIAAGTAWWLARVLLGHEQPAFAAIAAIISLGATAGREGRQVFELVFGVACGLAVADLLVSVMGVGVFQIGVVVALATAAALLLGEGKLLLNEAAISALLMIVLVPSGSEMSLDRFVDALVGSGVALAVHSLSPNNPRRTVERAARPIFTDLAAVLRETAAATRNGDLEQAETALDKARKLDARVSGFKESLATSYGNFRLLPPRKQSLGQLGIYTTAADQLDLAVRNTRVLARAAVSLVRNGKRAPVRLSETIQELSMAVEALAEYMESPDHPLHTRDLALEAAEDAASALTEQNDLDTNMLVGQVRSTAMDLLRASGMEPDAALAALREATGDIVEDPATTTG